MSKSSLCLLLLTLSALSTFAADVNIDCGSSSSYVDANDLEWVGDDDYTKSGQPMTVTSSNMLSDELVMNTLQVFSTGKTNCYTIPSVSEQVLVRASFYYGNYDKKSSPPTFDLLLGTNPWDTVVTSSNKTMRYEAIYVVNGTNIKVCVAQTSDDHIPFISALEIRSMSNDMYKYFDTDNALFLSTRAYLNDTGGSLLLDSSGRIWESKGVPSSMILQTSDAIIISGSDVADNPPEEVLRNALTVPKASHQIQLTTSSLPTTNVQVYVTMYFSEVAVLDYTTDLRSFNVYLEGELMTDEPIAPPYASVHELTMYNFKANSSTAFYLVATADSTLPPLINAFEVFVVSDVLVQTNDDDTTPPGTDTTPPGTDTTPPGTETTPASKPGSSTTTKKKKSSLPVILGTTIPALVAFWALVGFLAMRHQKRKSAAIAAISNMGQGGGPNGNKDFVVQMAANQSPIEEAPMNDNHHSSTDHHDNGSDH